MHPNGTNGTTVRVREAELSLADLVYRLGGREPVLLSPTEARILEILMSHAGLTMSPEVLAYETWGVPFEGAAQRVTVYVQRLRKKLERNPREPEFIHTIPRRGFVYLPPGLGPDPSPTGRLGDPHEDA